MQSYIYTISKRSITKLKYIMKNKIFSTIGTSLLSLLAMGVSTAAHAESPVADGCCKTTCESKECRKTTLYFAFDESLWYREYNATELAELIEWVKSNDDAVVEITGWSCLYDEGGMNGYISSSRALTAHIDLVDAGIAAERMIYKGMGSDSQSNRWKARRADIVAYIPSTPAKSYADLLDEAKYQEMEAKEPITLYATEMTPVANATLSSEVVANQVLGAKPRFDNGKFSLRANLVYWVGGLMNLGAEYNIPNTCLGIVVNGGYSALSNENWHNSLGGWFVSPEIRYYLGKNLNWFVGAQYLRGAADIKLFDHGRDASNITCAGLMGGYKKELNKNFSLDFTLGLGYTSFTFDRYTTDDDGVKTISAYDVKKKTVLPIQLGVNLIWDIVK